jgi:hypothetical protein
VSRGLSDKQRHILGLAAAVSRLHNGEPIGHEPRQNSDPLWGGQPVVTGMVRPDITVGLVAHVLYGVGLRRREGKFDKTKVWLETTPAALSARSSASHALTSLFKRGLVAFRGNVRAAPDNEWRLGTGYVLSVAGLPTGLEYEWEIPDLRTRVRYLQYSTQRVGEWAESPFELPPQFMPSPPPPLRQSPAANRDQRMDATRMMVNR